MVEVGVPANSNPEVLVSSLVFEGQMRALNAFWKDVPYRDEDIPDLSSRQSQLTALNLISEAQVTILSGVEYMNPYFLSALKDTVEVLGCFRDLKEVDLLTQLQQSREKLENSLSRPNP